MVEIIGQILSMEQAAKTEIMYKSALSYAQTQQYLGWLMERDLMRQADGNARAVIYKTTPKGRVLLPHIRVLMDALGLDNESWRPGAAAAMTRP